MAAEFLSDDDRARIRAAIQAAESKTTGDIVAVVARSASRYPAYTLLWSAVLAFFVPALLWASGLVWWSVQGLLITQLALFVLAALVISRTSLRWRLVPVAARREQADRLARRAFVDAGVHQTRDRTGVLIFVCVAEHFVEVLADGGIYQRVSRQVWADAVEQIVAKVRAGAVGDGFVHAIEQIGGVLAAEFPAGDGGRTVNELDDHLIEL